VKYALIFNQSKTLNFSCLWWYCFNLLDVHLGPGRRDVI